MMIRSPSTRTFAARKGFPAGPFFGSPVARSNMLPWAGHRIPRRLTSSTGRPACGHCLRKAQKTPGSGWVTT